MNNTNTNISLPLYPLFRQLQAYDRQLKHNALGMDVYFQLLDVLGQGYGIQNRADLYWYCKTIWLKPYHDEAKFKQLFDKYLDYLLISLKESKPIEHEGDENEASEKNVVPEDSKNEQQNSEEPDIIEPPDPSNTQPAPVEKKKTTKKVALKFQSPTSQQEQFLETNLKNIEEKAFSKIFRLKGKYSTISPRKVKQSIRSLQIEKEGNIKKFIDLEATINQVAQNGYLKEVVLKAGTITNNKLSILVDVGGSMIGFQDLTELLTKTISTHTAQSDLPVLYFRNSPITKLYYSAGLTKSMSLSSFIKKFHSSIIILSDAGAARGRYDQKRIEVTHQFLNKMTNFPMIWINPMPKNRWEETSAEIIATYIDMYEATDTAFVRAIKQLKQLNK